MARKTATQIRKTVSDATDTAARTGKATVKSASSGAKNTVAAAKGATTSTRRVGRNTTKTAKAGAKRTASTASGAARKTAATVEALLGLTRSAR